MRAGDPTLRRRERSLDSLALAIAGRFRLELGKEFPPAPGGAEIRPDASGFLLLTSKGIEEDFAQDIPKPQRRILAATQGPTNGACFVAKLTNAAWKSKPSWYVRPRSRRSRRSSTRSRSTRTKRPRAAPSSAV